jgi:hypothetical protein
MIVISTTSEPEAVAMKELMEAAPAQISYSVYLRGSLYSERPEVPPVEVR